MECARRLAVTIALTAAAVGDGANVPATPSTQEPAVIRIGLVESDPSIAGSLLAGAKSAVSELNSEGGISGHSLELLHHVSAQPWRGVANAIANLMRQDGVVALIGASDGATAHLAVQITTRHRIPLITLSPEDSLTQAKDPWIFRAVPNDTTQARVLLEATLPHLPNPRVAIVVPHGRSGRERLAAVERACRAVGIERTIVIRSGKDQKGSVTAVDLGAVASADLLLLWLDAEPALDFLDQLGPERTPDRFLGSIRLDDHRFLKGAPPWATRLSIPMLRPVSDAEMDLATFMGYDLVKVIAEAIRAADTQSNLVRDALAGNAGDPTSSSSRLFGPRGNSQRGFTIGTLRDGRLVAELAVSP